MLIKLAEQFRRPELFNWRFYRGKVVANNDPKKIKRVKVSVEGIFPEGNNDNLPWVGAYTDSPKSVNVPEVGDELIIIFPFDDIYHPFYMGHWNTGTTGQAYLQDDYPNTFGFVYNNLKARFNKNTKIGEIIHSSGSGLAVDADGNLVLTGAKNITQTAGGKFNVSSASDFDIASGGKLNVSSTQDMSFMSSAKLTMTSTGNMKFTSQAMFEASGTGGTTIGSMSSPTIINGATVNIGGQGGTPVALVATSMVVGLGNLGFPVVSQILSGSSKVLAAP